MDEIIIEEIEKKEEILLEEKILIPKLDNLIIIPTAEEQNFKNKNYGYGDITVKAIESEEVAIIPNANEQIKEGMFNKVTVAGESNLLPENIKSGTSIFGVVGTMEGAWDSSQIRRCIYMFYLNKEMIEAPYFNTENVTIMNNMFDGCSNLTTVPHYNTKNVTDMSYMFRDCANLKEIPEMNTSNVTSFLYMLNWCTNIEKIPLLNASKIINIRNFLHSASSSAYSKLVYIGGFKDLGKAYTQKKENYSSYKLFLDVGKNITHESLMNVINNLYDLNLTYNVAGGGKLYAQSLALGRTNLAKLTAEEIAIATSKGWNIT